MSEEWMDVLDGNYEVSDMGNVRRKTPGRRTWPGRMMKRIVAGAGYWMVGPTVNGKNKHMLVHRLVAEAFLGKCPDGCEVNHKDGNKLNARADNLEYVTHAGNMAHSAASGLHPRGELCGNTHLTDKDVLEIRRLDGEGVGLPEICDRFGIARPTACQIVNGDNWKHLPVGKRRDRTTRGEHSASAKLTESDVLDIRSRRSSGETMQSIADDYGLATSTISSIERRLTWKHVK